MHHLAGLATEQDGSKPVSTLHYSHQPQVAKICGGPAACSRDDLWWLTPRTSLCIAPYSRTALKYKCGHMPAFIMLAFVCHAQSRHLAAHLSLLQAVQVLLALSVTVLTCSV
jgi:hypothetical protein